MSFVTASLAERIGTKIEATQDVLLSGEYAETIRALLEQRGVLVFPQVGMDDRAQLAFARSIGQVIPQGEKGIYKVTLDAKITPTAEYLHGTVLWHIDGWADDVPARGSILSGRVLSPTGGQTEFANTYAAYDDLPPAKKQEIEGLQVLHTMAGTQRDVFPNAPEAMKANWARHTPKIHPLVWTHRSGRKSLLLGSSADVIQGLQPDRSAALLAELKEWAVQQHFVYRHEWQVGDMVIWDNCGVLHRVEPYAADSGRMMHRVTLEGEEPIA